MPEVHCGQCDATLEESPSLPTEERLPCPACGATARRVLVMAEAAAAVGSASQATVIKHAQGAAHSTVRASSTATGQAGPARTVEDTGTVTRLLHWSRTGEDGKMRLGVTENEAGDILHVAVGENPEDLLLELAESLLPPEDPGA